jgi:hypothetical protein
MNICKITLACMRTVDFQRSLLWPHSSRTLQELMPVYKPGCINAKCSGAERGFILLSLKLILLLEVNIV